MGIDVETEARPIAIEEKGARLLAVPTGVSGADFIKSQISSLQQEHGWIVRGGHVQPWNIRGFTQREGQIYFTGEYHDGVRLADCWDDGGMRNLGRLKSLVAALLALRASKDIPFFRLRADSVFFLGDAGVLFLPPGIMQRVSMLSPFSSRVRTYHVLNHPDWSGEKLQSFGIAVLAYRMLIGRFPFDGSDDVEVNNRIRNFRITAPSLIRPDVVPDLSDAIVRSVSRGTQPLTLQEWDAALYRWITEGITREVPEAERTELVSRGEERTSIAARRYRRIVFFQRNWRLMAIVGGVLAIVGVVLGSILSNVLAPRVTRGLPPQEVVRTFYESMNDLDHSTMEDCVIGDAGKGEINEAMNLYVMSRMTMGYEGKSYIVSAQAWDSEGRPELSAQHTIYGAIIHEIVQERGAPDPVFRVRYEKWMPEPEDGGEREGETAPRSYGYMRTELVSMRQDKGDWVIEKIERRESAPIKQATGG